MTKIIETETFTVNADGTLKVTILTEFTDSIEEPYIIYRTVTDVNKFVDRAYYKSQKENVKWEGKMEAERGTEKVMAADKILRELGQTDIPK